MECLIPFIIANLVNQIKAGCEFQVIAVYGLVLVLMAGISLLFGAWAGNTCSTASCGLAKNLRKDMFYNIQNFSFENIDKFSASSLVTRLTTDVTNVQMAYMMIIRIAIRRPLMLIFAFIMAFVMGGKMAAIFSVRGAGAGLWLVPGDPQGDAAFQKGVQKIRRPEQLDPRECQGHPCGKVFCAGGL